MHATDCARKVLSEMSQNPTGSYQTIRLMSRLGLEDNTGNRTSFRSVMDRLRGAGRVKKWGKGKFYWTLVPGAFPCDYPFDPMPNSPAAVDPQTVKYQQNRAMNGGRSVPDRAGWRYVVGKTFEVRQSLKDMGGWWDGEAWSVPADREPDVRALGLEMGDPVGANDPATHEPTPVKDESTTPPVPTTTPAQEYPSFELFKTVFNTQMENVMGEVTHLRRKLNATVAELEEVRANSGRVIKELKIEKWDGSFKTLRDVVLPATFGRVMDLAKCRRNILLVGPAGCGKSHLAQMVADGLGLDFGSVSCTSGMSESHLLGRSVPDLTHGKNRFQGTDFLRCYEEGGLFLLDELDAADPNLLLAVNTALANGYCNVPNRPDKPRAVKHADFVCIATANTFGRGATRQYSGRNQLDESTLDRFRIGIVECEYDEAVEMVLCPDADLRGELTRVRRKISGAGLRRIMSTRFMQDAYTMKVGAGWTDSQILEVFFEGWSDDEKAKVR